MEKNDMELKQRIYDLMNGSLDLENYSYPESQIVENEYAEGKPCSKLYEEVYNANRRLCKRLGVEEDHDVEIIISNLMKIGEYECMKMYDYGVRFSKEQS